MSDWYYASNGEQKGPTNESEVKAFLAGGQIPPETLVWKDGMENWMPANQVPAFSFRQPPAPAKVQPTQPAPVAAPATSSLPAPKTKSAEPARAVASVDVADQFQKALSSASSGEGTLGDPEDVAKNKTMAILAYIIFLVPLIVCRDSTFAKYHTNQGLILWLASMVVSVPVTIVFVILELVLGSWVGYLSTLFHLAFMVVVVFFIYVGVTAANKGLMKPLPFIGSLFTIIK